MPGRYCREVRRRRGAGGRAAERAWWAQGLDGAGKAAGQQLRNCATSCSHAQLLRSTSGQERATITGWPAGLHGGSGGVVQACLEVQAVRAEVEQLLHRLQPVLEGSMRLHWTSGGELQ